MKNLVDYYETADDVAVKDFLYECSIEGMDIQKIEQPKLVKSEFYKKKDQKIFVPKI